jgi:hypothetical protein
VPRRRAQAAYSLGWGQVSGEVLVKEAEVDDDVESNSPSYRSQAAAAERAAFLLMYVLMMIESISLTLSQVNPRYWIDNPHSSRKANLCDAQVRCHRDVVDHRRQWNGCVPTLPGRASTDINLGGHAIVDRRLVLLLWRSCSSMELYQGRLENIDFRTGSTDVLEWEGMLLATTHFVPLSKCTVGYCSNFRLYFIPFAGWLAIFGLYIYDVLVCILLFRFRWTLKHRRAFERFVKMISITHVTYQMYINVSILHGLLI